MKLGSLKSKDSRDGILCVIDRHLKKAARFEYQGVKTLRDAIENWDQVVAKLQDTYLKLNQGTLQGAFDLKQEDFHSPLPRAFQWIDGSAFLHHVRLVRMARNAPIPPTLTTDPLFYQGCSDDFLAPFDPIPQVDPSHGTDFEGEVAVITRDVPMGTSPEEALKKILLVMIVNDVSLRGLIPKELEKGFGFFQSKPQSSFAPFAVTPDELGAAYQEGRVHLPLHVDFNGNKFGRANAKDMHFHFGQLIAFAAMTRPLAAGTIVGSGTVSNEDPAVGSSCLAEKRMIEQIETGAMKTPFMQVGDRVKMEMFHPDGTSLFGRIEQSVAKA